MGKVLFSLLFVVFILQKNVNTFTKQESSHPFRLKPSLIDKKSTTKKKFIPQEQPSPQIQKKLLIIPKIEFEEINEWYYAYIYSCFQKAKKWKANAILLELDTPGGRGDIASKIVSLIIACDIPVYVYINDNAISAGAVISIAANKIFIRKGGIIGASQPVDYKGEPSGEKTMSFLRTKFRSLAELRKRPGLICEAMVDPSIVLTKKAHGINCPKGKLLTLSSQQAISLKVIEDLAADREEVIQKIQFSKEIIFVNTPSLAMRMLRFFSSRGMWDFLQMLSFLGIAIEMRTPGWGIGGALAICSATLGFVIQLSLDRIEWFIPGMFGFGIILLGLEAFVFPGVGIAGVLGILMCAGSLLFGVGAENIPRAITTGGISFVGCMIFTSVIFTIFSKLKFFRNIFSLDQQIDHIIQRESSCKKLRVNMSELGKVIVPLRPIGRVLFASGSVEAACTDNRFLDKGKKVRIVGFEDFKILVEEIKK